MHSDTLWAALTTTTCIHLVSDAMVHPNGTGTCAWIIWANSKVWNGQGYIPGMITDMYSGLAEAYGIYAVLSFFHQYTTLYPLALPAPHTIHVHCNNNGVIECINNTPSSLHPCNVICNDTPYLWNYIPCYKHSLWYEYYSTTSRDTKKRWLTTSLCYQRNETLIVIPMHPGWYPSLWTPQPVPTP